VVNSVTPYPSWYHSFLPFCALEWRPPAVGAEIGLARVAERSDMREPQWCQSHQLRFLDLRFVAHVALGARHEELFSCHAVSSSEATAKADAKVSPGNESRTASGECSFTH